MSYTGKSKKCNEIANILEKQGKEITAESLYGWLVSEVSRHTHDGEKYGNLHIKDFIHYMNLRNNGNTL